MKEQKTMNPQEKWNRLSNPQCLKDYGLSITEEEMVSFPEGKNIVRTLKLTKIKHKIEVMTKKENG